MSRAGVGRPWVGRSYAHLVLPYPHLNEHCLEVLDRAVADDDPSGEWSVAGDGSPSPRLMRHWKHAAGGSLILLVLGWYPVLMTVGPDGNVRARSRARKAQNRLIEAVFDNGGRAVADRDLDRVLDVMDKRWQRVLDARRRIEQHRIWVDCRQCANCGDASASTAVHCRGCGRRFTSADDAEREERSAPAREAINAAERELEALGHGEGLFRGWPGSSYGDSVSGDPQIQWDHPTRHEPPAAMPTIGVR